MVCAKDRGGCGYEDDISRFKVTSGNTSKCPECGNESAVRIADGKKKKRQPEQLKLHCPHCGELLKKIGEYGEQELWQCTVRPEHQTERPIYDDLPHEHNPPYAQTWRD